MMSLAIVAVAVQPVVVGASFGLEGSLRPHEARAEAQEHVLDDVIRPDAKSLVPNFSGQMSIAKMPGEPHELRVITVPNFDNSLVGCSNPQPHPILELQSIAIGHRDRFWKIDKDIPALICAQANAAAMSRIKADGKGVSSLFSRPLAGAAMD